LIGLLQYADSGQFGSRFYSMQLIDQTN